jgi:hypothetical protein
VSLVSQLEHADHARNADRAASDRRVDEAHRRLVFLQETIGACRSRGGLATVVAAQRLFPLRPVEEECTPADAGRLRLHEAEDHLDRNGRVQRRAAALEHFVSRIHRERVRRRNDEPSAAFRSAQLRARSGESKQDRREGRAKLQCTQHDTKA